MSSVLLVFDALIKPFIGFFVILLQWMFSIRPLQHKNTWRLIKNTPNVTQIQCLNHPPVTREPELSILRESKLIGAHYAPRMHTFKKPKTLRPTGSSVTEEGSDNETALSQETRICLQTAAVLRLSITAPLNTVETFIMTWRGFAMQMRVRCFLRRAAVVFVSRVCEAAACAFFCRH